MRSLSEIETVVKRASRAVGYSWGNSEEVGKSIRQLELFGFKGIKNLNKYYKDKSTKKFEDLNNICDECKEEDESVSQNLILTGFKICKSCRVSKTIFPI